MVNGRRTSGRNMSFARSGTRRSDRTSSRPKSAAVHQKALYIQRYMHCRISVSAVNVRVCVHAMPSPGFVDITYSALVDEPDRPRAFPIKQNHEFCNCRRLLGLSTRPHQCDRSGFSYRCTDYLCRILPFTEKARPLRYQQLHVDNSLKYHR